MVCVSWGSWWNGLGEPWGRTGAIQSFDLGATDKEIEQDVII